MPIREYSIMTYLYMCRSSLLLLYKSNNEDDISIVHEINHIEMRIKMEQFIIYSTLSNKIGLFLSKHPCIVL